MLEENLRETLIHFDYTDDREVRFIPKDKPRGSTTAYLTTPERIELSTQISDSAALLMTCFYQKVTTPKYDFFDDAKVATHMGWSTAKTKKVRLALVKAGWLKKIVYTQYTTKSKVTIFYLGKEMCSKVETPEEFNQRMKRVEEVRKPIMDKLGCSTWQEVLDNHDEEYVIGLLRNA